MDDYPKPTPRFKVGELVRCWYDFLPYYGNITPFGYEEEAVAATHGLIVEVEYAMFSEVYGYEILYVVLGLDGKCRYFAEEEVRRYP